MLPLSKKVLLQAFERMEAQQRAQGKLGAGELETKALVATCVDFAGADEESDTKAELFHQLKLFSHRDEEGYDFFYNNVKWNYLLSYEEEDTMTMYLSTENDDFFGTERELCYLMKHADSRKLFDMAWEQMVSFPQCILCQAFVEGERDVCMYCRKYYNTLPCPSCLKHVGLMTMGEHPRCKMRRLK